MIHGVTQEIQINERLFLYRLRTSTIFCTRERFPIFSLPMRNWRSLKTWEGNLSFSYYFDVFYGYLLTVKILYMLFLKAWKSNWINLCKLMEVVRSCSIFLWKEQKKICTSSLPWVLYPMHLGKNYNFTFSFSISSKFAFVNTL